MNQAPFGSSSERNAGAGADLRGFSYELEALRRQRAWKLDQLRMQMSQAQQFLGEQRQKLAQLNASHAAGGADAIKAAQIRLNPSTHICTLTYLARLQRDIARQQEMVNALLRQQDVLKQDYIREQQRLEALNRHREHAVNAYASEWLRRQAVETDRDWLARVATKHNGSRELASFSQEISK
jgi:flagellar biosynthesis chaperone FliJ